VNYSKVTHAEDFAAKMLRKARMAALETLRRGVGQGRQGPQRAESSHGYGNWWAKCCDRSNGGSEPKSTDAAQGANDCNHE